MKIREWREGRQIYKKNNSKSNDGELIFSYPLRYRLNTESRFMHTWDAKSRRSLALSPQAPPGMKKKKRTFSP